MDLPLHEDDNSGSDVNYIDETESEYCQSSAETDSDDSFVDHPLQHKSRRRKSTVESSSPHSATLDHTRCKTTKVKRSGNRHRDRPLEKYLDDGLDKVYDARIRALNNEASSAASDNKVAISGGFEVLKHVWEKLYKYQKTGVKWLWELHQQVVGGICGDEMGLGKTVQVIVFLGSLVQSNLRSATFDLVGLGPVLIVCPATVMHQWVREFHKWVPRQRVVLLHSTGSYTGKKERFLTKMVHAHAVVITSYGCLTYEHEVLLKYDWHYVILDEGHKIRNPDAKVTLAAKQFRTPHRLILSGTPIQNSLKELWSLFDFVYPGLLGTLPVFMEEFSVPITQGGYANATQVQVQTAFKCACVLRDVISPYLLRRVKANVQMAIQLPSKTEQALFCRLTDTQRALYKDFLASRECASILSGSMDAFAGLIVLRKICNHPDLVDGGPNKLGLEDLANNASSQYGYYKRSGKMLVVDMLLKLWHEQCHRVLLFSQSKQMLDILESYVKFKEYSYMRMDGGTYIGQRQNIVHKFNNDSSIFILLLTTRVGGLGLNLTGADRVILFDPDWNPSTDAQARERAWRIGQTKPTTVYRLLTSGTIEEKIYHRQIFKQFLTNRVLNDPKQRRFFKTNDLHELFTLTDDLASKGSETASLFAGTNSEIRSADVVKERKRRKKTNFFDERAKGMPAKKRKRKSASLDEEDIDFVPEAFETSANRLAELRQLAKKLSQQFEAAKVDAATAGGIIGSASTQQSTVDADTGTSITHSSSSVVEGVAMPFVTGQETVRAEKTDEAFTEDLEATSRANDNDVLAKLFKRSQGILSALRHDTIVGPAGSADYALVEGEAEKLARRAAKVLAASRRRCRESTIGQLTWTGRHGTGGAPKQKMRFGNGARFSAKKSSQPLPSTVNSNVVASSSADLLRAIRTRKQREASSDLSSDEEPLEDAPEQPVDSATATPSRYAELMDEIRVFLALRGGEATTNDVLRKFENVNATDAAVFRAMLKKLCELTKQGGNGVWRLRPEYR